MHIIYIQINNIKQQKKKKKMTLPARLDNLINILYR